LLNRQIEKPNHRIDRRQVRDSVRMVKTLHRHEVAADHVTDSDRKVSEDHATDNDRKVSEDHVTVNDRKVSEDHATDNDRKVSDDRGTVNDRKVSDDRGTVSRLEVDVQMDNRASEVLRADSSVDVSVVAREGPEVLAAISS
jgi:hypothetical protein